MNEQIQLKLQAYADGELGGRETREVADLLSADADARALLDELQNTRRALVGFEADLKLPESREFYWSKIAREIERAEPARRAAAPGSLAGLLQRWLLPASALAALVVAGLLVNTHWQNRRAPEVEVAMADSDPFTYHDYSSGTTLIWLSFPAVNDLADLEPDDTLD